MPRATSRRMSGGGWETKVQTRAALNPPQPATCQTTRLHGLKVVSNLPSHWPVLTYRSEESWRASHNFHIGPEDALAFFFSHLFFEAVRFELVLRVFESLRQPQSTLARFSFVGSHTSAWRSSSWILKSHQNDFMTCTKAHTLRIFCHDGHETQT